MPLPLEKKSRADQHHNSYDTYAPMPGQVLRQLVLSVTLSGRCCLLHSQVKKQRLSEADALAQNHTASVSRIVWLSSAFPRPHATLNHRQLSQRIIWKSLIPPKRYNHVLYLLCPPFINLFIHSTNWYMWVLLHVKNCLFWEALHSLKQCTKKQLQLQVFVSFASHMPLSRNNPKTQVIKRIRS